GPYVPIGPDHHVWTRAAGAGALLLLAVYARFRAKALVLLAGLVGLFVGGLASGDLSDIEAEPKVAGFRVEQPGWGLYLTVAAGFLLAINVGQFLFRTRRRVPRT